MTEAELEPTGAADPLAMGASLARAREFLADAARGDNRDASRVVLAQHAVIAACDALLALAGLRVVGSEGGHRVRLDAVHQRFFDDRPELFERLDAVRADRNRVSYAGGLTPAVELADGLAAVRELVALAAERIEPRLGGNGA